MASRHKEIEKELDLLKRSNLYRGLRSVIVKGPLAIVDGKEKIHLCSNDYLGLAHDQDVIKKAIESLEEISPSSSRLIAGNHPKIIELEGMLAEHRRTESALVYPTGYSANLGAITAVAKNSTIFSDELNHASIIDACRLSGAAVKVFRHNQQDHLASLLQKAKGKKIVVTEGIFSMDGDEAKLDNICQIAADHKAMMVVDDAHGDFIFGRNFSGVPSHLGVNSMVDLHISSMSKGLGCFGGYVAASRPIRELLVNTSRQFIYTSALPEHLCSAAIAAIPLAMDGDLQKRLFSNIKYFSTKLKKLGYQLGQSKSQIIPILIGDEKLAVDFSNELLERGVFAQAVRYPTVRKGAARLRVSLTSLHTEELLARAADSFEETGRKFEIM